MTRDDPRSRRVRSVILRGVAVMTLAVAAQLFWMSADPERGLPLEGQLVAVTGTLVKMVFRDDTIWFALSGHKDLFRYSSKMGNVDAVARALKHRGAEVRLKYDPGKSRGPVDVFHLSVNGKVIRTYAQIRQSWISSNKLGRWGGILFLLAGLYLLYAARRDSRGAEVSSKNGA